MAITLTSLRSTKDKIIKTREKEDKAAKNLRQAKTKIDLEKAKIELLKARQDRKNAELEAKIKLGKLRTQFQKQKAAELRASDEKWEARYKRIGTVATGLGKAIKGSKRR